MHILDEKTSPLSTTFVAIEIRIGVDQESSAQIDYRTSRRCVIESIVTSFITGFLSVGPISALQPYLTSSSYRDGEDDDDDEEEIEREIEHLERRLRAAKNHLIFVSCQKK